jgi:hypothetical protein
MGEKINIKQRHNNNIQYFVHMFDKLKDYYLYYLLIQMPLYDCPIKLVMHFLSNKGFPGELIKIIIKKLINNYSIIPSFGLIDSIALSNFDRMFMCDKNTDFYQARFNIHTNFALEAIQ